MRSAIFFGLIVAAETAAGNHLAYDPGTFEFMAYLAVAMMVMDVADFIKNLTK